MSELNKSNSEKDKFPFEADIIARFKKWPGLMDSDLEEALKEITGDTYFEMRKLISQLFSEIEKLIISDKYPGYINGKELTPRQKENITREKEDFKECFRTLIEASWRSILIKQKIGVDKLGLALKSHLISNAADKNNSLSSSSD